MQFLFHIPLLIKNEFVYFNIHKISEEKYFAEVLDNPKGVNVSDFHLTKNSSEWVSEHQPFSNLAQVIGEEIEIRK